MNSNEIYDVVTIGFEAGLKCGLKVGRQRVLDAIEDLHVHTEHGAIVHLEDLHDLLEERDAQRQEAKLP